MREYNRKDAIRLKCFDCSGFQKLEIRLCPIKDCALYPYRLGKIEHKAFCEPRGAKDYLKSYHRVKLR